MGTRGEGERASEKTKHMNDSKLFSCSCFCSCSCSRGGEFFFSRLSRLTRQEVERCCNNKRCSVCVCVWLQKKRRRKKPTNQPKKSLKKYFERTNTRMRESEWVYVCVSFCRHLLLLILFNHFLRIEHTYMEYARLSVEWEYKRSFFQVE